MILFNTLSYFLLGTEFDIKVCVIDERIGRPQYTMMASEQILTFVCDLCDAKCSTKRSAERHHKMAHSGEKPIQCDLCPRMFALKFLKESHQESPSDQM